MKKTKIMVRRDAKVESVSKVPQKNIYEVKTKVNPHLYVTYTGYRSQPKVGTKTLKKGDTVWAGQTIRG